MDLVETDDHFVLRADLPGLGEGDVMLEVQDNKGVLEVRIPKPEQREPRRVEIAVGDGTQTAIEGTTSDATQNGAPVAA